MHYLACVVGGGGGGGVGGHACVYCSEASVTLKHSVRSGSQNVLNRLVKINGSFIMITKFEETRLRRLQKRLNIIKH